MTGAKRQTDAAAAMDRPGDVKELTDAGKWAQLRTRELTLEIAYALGRIEGKLDAAIARWEAEKQAGGRRAR